MGLSNSLTSGKDRGLYKPQIVFPTFQRSLRSSLPFHKCPSFSSADSHADKRNPGNSHGSQPSHIRPYIRFFQSRIPSCAVLIPGAYPDALSEWWRDRLYVRLVCRASSKTSDTLRRIASGLPRSCRIDLERMSEAFLLIDKKRSRARKRPSTTNGTNEFQHIVLLSFHRPLHIPSPFHCASPFSLFFTPLLTKERQRLPLLIVSGNRPTPAHPTLSLPSQPSRIPADASIQNPSAFLQPKCFPESQSARSKKLPEQQSNHHESMPNSISRLPTRGKGSRGAGCSGATNSGGICLSFVSV